MTYYKIVTKGYYDGKLYSACLNFPHQFEKIFRCEYQIGEWTFPKLQGSKLFVFNDLDAARYFRYDSIDWKLYECEIMGEPETPTIIPSCLQMAEYWAQQILSINVDTFISSIDDIDPKTTALVEAVKLTKEL